MKLRPTSHLMLGMLGLGATSGYAIKKLADVSTHYFWPTSLAQVYPELAKLEEAGLVSRADDPRGARARSSYLLTGEGEEALRRWLRSYRPEEMPPQIRDEGLLRLFFADALEPAEQHELLARMRHRLSKGEAHMRTSIIPIADALEQRTGRRFPAISARLGADSFAFLEQWLARLADELAEAGGPA